ncbi:hypothetical protein G3O06_20620 [Burkholderia sp. Ac-20345]|uniref:Mor transcription activator family protein n=1 Tax=Burkholderia sp. Ac-20345 TaxID=2703891 RepID=UPI00197C74E8|nr:hypothetical protein [Burkholderia sp. Ac-20345]
MTVPDRPTFPAQLPELLEHFAQIAYRKMREGSVEHAPAERVALSIVNAVAEQFGGAQLYIPFPETYMRSERDMEIFRKYTGSYATIFELAREYHLSEARVRRIIRRVGEEQFRERQPDMFA